MEFGKTVWVKVNSWKWLLDAQKRRPHAAALASGVLRIFLN